MKQQITENEENLSFWGKCQGVDSDVKIFCYHDFGVKSVNILPNIRNIVMDFIIYYSKFDRDHVLMQHKILTNYLMNPKLKQNEGKYIIQKLFYS